MISSVERNTLHALQIQASVIGVVAFWHDIPRSWTKRYRLAVTAVAATRCRIWIPDDGVFSLRRTLFGIRPPTTAPEMLVSKH